MDSLIKLFWQAARFGIIGVIAACVHFSVVVGLVEFFSLTPLLANLFGFTVAIQISYWGHRHWTFRGTNVTHAFAVPRLLVVYLTSLFANEGLFYLALHTLKLPYTTALLIVLFAMAGFTFIMNKVWVFA